MSAKWVGKVRKVEKSKGYPRYQPYIVRDTGRALEVRVVAPALHNREKALTIAKGAARANNKKRSA